MTTTRRFLVFGPLSLAAALALFPACSGPTSPCAEGPVRACACAEGVLGTATCMADGTYAACRCAMPGDASVPPDASRDAGRPDGGRDAGTPDGGPPLDCATDDDGDGFVSAACCSATAPIVCGPDCNDMDRNVHPGAVDRPPLGCDLVDNDCDGVTDETCPCVTGETRDCGTEPALRGVGVCRAGTQTCALGMFSSACIGVVDPVEERCNSLDDDCDGVLDEHVLRTFYRDADGDGRGVMSEAMQACAVPEGYSMYGDDCDDTMPGVHPAVPEVCNGIDDDCDGMTDESLTGFFYRDADGDGFGTPGMTISACSAPPGYARIDRDCDDTRAAVHPGAVEICDGLDNNCDGMIDPGCMCLDGATRACAQPGVCAAGSETCAGGAWGACSISPVIEVCDGEDDDCDGSIDEELTTLCYPDADMDGFGEGAGVRRCACAAGEVAIGGDCDGASTSVHPGATELCNGVDDDCDSMVDEGC